MITLSCPLPENINPLKSNGFMLSITKLPLVSFYSQTVALPDISLPSSKQATPLSDIYYAGDKLVYGDLQIAFMVDESMNNYNELNNWLIGLGFPENNQQYIDFNSLDTINKNEASKNSSDGTLTILDNSNKPIRSVKFIDLIPTRLESLPFASTNNDVIYLTGRATFSYSYYEFI